MYSQVNETSNNKLGSMGSSARDDDLEYGGSSQYPESSADSRIYDTEIAIHYNSRCKYGLAGSDGTFWSNYYRHTMNNHELLSLFFADKRNPYDRARRFFVIFSKLSFALMLAAAFNTMHRSRYDSPSVSTPLNIQFGDSFIISILMAPYGCILDSIARCSICTKRSICVRAFSVCSYCTLLTIALVSGLFLMSGILIAVYELNTNEFVAIFFYSVLLDYASYFYYGFWNWFFLSWDGFLCIPVFPVFRESGFPCRFLPVFSFWPLRLFLQMWGLCENTYAEDKRAFEIAYPGRVAVDSGSGSGSGPIQAVKGTVLTDYDEQDFAVDQNFTL